MYKVISAFSPEELQEKINYFSEKGYKVISHAIAPRTIKGWNNDREIITMHFSAVLELT